VAAKRDQGLLRALGPWSLASGIFSMIVGAGIFAAPAAMAQALGAWAPLNFRWVKAAAAIGVGSMIVLIALAAPVEILGLALLVGLSAVLYLAQTRGRLARDSA